MHRVPNLRGHTVHPPLPQVRNWRALHELVLEPGWAYPAHSCSPFLLPWPLQRYHLGCFSSSYSSHGYPCYFFILIIHSYRVPFYFFRALVPDFIITYWYICILVCLLTESHEFHTEYIYLWPITWSKTHYKLGTKGKKWMDYWINEYAHKQFWK